MNERFIQTVTQTTSKAAAETDPAKIVETTVRAVDPEGAELFVQARFGKRSSWNSGTATVYTNIHGDGQPFVNLCMTERREDGSAVRRTIRLDVTDDDALLFAAQLVLLVRDARRLRANRILELERELAELRAQG